MKFKTIFIIFNIFLLFFLAVMLLTPVFLLGPDLAPMFWRGNWFIILVLALILVVFDAYFMLNRQLYTLLEREDWPALAHYLEEQVIGKRRYRPYLVKLLANTYLVLADSNAVINLENKAGMIRPSLVDDNVLVFGTAHLLGKDISGAVRFFESRMEHVKPALLPWVRWYYGFALLLNRKYGAGADEFSFLAKRSPDGIIAGLSAFILNESIARYLPSRTAELRAAAAEGAARTKKVFTRQADWIKETGRLSAEIHAAVMVKYLDKAGNWLYTEQSGETHENI